MSSVIRNSYSLWLNYDSHYHAISAPPVDHALDKFISRMRYEWKIMPSALAAAVHMILVRNGNSVWTWVACYAIESIGDLENDVGSNLMSSASESTRYLNVTCALRTINHWLSCAPKLHYRYLQQAFTKLFRK